MGIESNAGNLYYSCVFSATIFLTEVYGKKIGFRSIRLAASTIFAFIILSKIAVNITPAMGIHTQSDAMDVLFSFAPRIAFASVTAYIIAQTFLVFFYDALHSSKSSKEFWFRIVIASIFGQAIDSFWFFSVAFLGSVPLLKIMEFGFWGFIVKSFVAFASVPFLYWARSIAIKSSPTNT